MLDLHANFVGSSAQSNLKGRIYIAEVLYIAAWWPCRIKCLTSTESGQAILERNLLAKLARFQTPLHSCAEPNSFKFDSGATYLGATTDSDGVLSAAPIKFVKPWRKEVKNFHRDVKSGILYKHVADLI